MSCSQKLLPWRGIELLSGAQPDLAYREINTLPQRHKVPAASHRGYTFPRRHRRATRGRHSSRLRLTSRRPGSVLESAEVPMAACFPLGRASSRVFVHRSIIPPSPVEIRRRSGIVSPTGGFLVLAGKTSKTTQECGERRSYIPIQTVPGRRWPTGQRDDRFSGIVYPPLPAAYPAAGFPTDPALRAAGQPAQAGQSGTVPAIPEHAGTPPASRGGAKQAGPGSFAGTGVALSAMSYRHTRADPVSPVGHRSAAAADGYVLMSFRAGPIRPGVIAIRSERQGCIRNWKTGLLGTQFPWFSDDNPLPASLSKRCRGQAPPVYPFSGCLRRTLSQIESP